MQKITGITVRNKFGRSAPPALAEVRIIREALHPHIIVYKELQ